MTPMDILVAAALVVAGATFLGWLVWGGIRHQRAQPFEVVFTSGVNDDNQAVAKFIEVVGHATRRLIIHDDGNKMPGTIYDSAEATEALDAQMNTHKGLVVECLFNSRDKLAMVEQLRHRHPSRFKVKYRRWPWRRPAFDVRYKIADDGAFGHLSHHPFGVKERHFEVRDCSDANQTERDIEQVPAPVQAAVPAGKRRMTYGELPAIGLYVVLSIVVVWSAMLTAQIADVRKRELTNWKVDAKRLRKFATQLLLIARVCAGQLVVVLLFAAWEAYEAPPQGQGPIETWWSPAQIVVHLGIVVALFAFLVSWFQSMERTPKTPY